MSHTLDTMATQNNKLPRANHKSQTHAILVHYNNIIAIITIFGSF